MDNSRPNPDKLLKMINEASNSRGKLKIYLGMAAGVGKTYAMLVDALDLRKKGCDVVAGYIEPHGRQETEELIGDLERLPTSIVRYKGVELSEFDLDAAKKRKPGFILVDELAHTNAPGSYHQKRWEDVLDLLDMGINVHTTMNVQHLESLSDVVTSITQIEIRETVPDSVLAKADTIELIDLPPAELIERLKEGKVYPLSKVQTALDNFFKEGNLLALREIALRKAAEKIDEQVLDYRQKKDISEVWQTSEKILVGISANKFARKLVRAGARIAASKHAELVVVSVETAAFQFLSDESRRLLEDAVMLANKLGATIERRVGEDVVQELLAVAVFHNVSTIVVGKPIRKSLHSLFRSSVADQIIERSGTIEVHLISGSIEESAQPPLINSQENSRPWTYSITVAITLLTTCLCYLLTPVLHPTNIAMVYVLASVVTALMFGRRESSVSALANVLAFDFFFVEPRLSFTVQDIQYLVTFVVMLVTSLIMSTLTLRIRLQSKAVAERERRTQCLYEMGRKVTSTLDPKVIGDAIVNSVRQLANVDVCFLLDVNGELISQPASQSKFESDSREKAVASYAFSTRKAAGVGTDVLPGATGLYMPACFEHRAFGVVGIKVGERFDRSMFPFFELLIQQIAACLERNRLLEDSYQARLAAETQSARGILLRSISHDFRTPLTVIAGAASALLLSPQSADPGVKIFAENIREQSERLTKMVSNVLELTRLESCAIEPQREWESVEELIAGALEKTEELIKGRNVILNISETLPLVYVNAGLIEKLLVNVIENSGYYATGATKLVLEANPDQFMVIIKISDDGPGFRDEANILEPKARRQDGGTGLGLLICEAIARIHGGKFVTKSSETGGAMCILELPLDSNKGLLPDAVNNQRASC